ncbi:hypothetical protein N657DRAFT_639881 [Parathielavia appendiculata]|uniref:Uncharacterized protein n=1 Tax=Parathielavia appendiculata TaxID=2587402 RepID=A0AAN6UAL8_9PEZI|nr:hypothetical protein N657DRAFT_639881 [Parathielavia appendiculata]
MESIQLAQMLADLSDLHAAHDSQAARALVNASKSLPTSSQSTSSAEPSKPPEPIPSRPGLRNHKRTGSTGSQASTASSFMSRTASPAKFDKYGRRIATPPNTRTNSAYGSIPGTPRRDSEQMDDDVDRANTLMALYEIRAKLKDQDSSRNLSKLREKVAALHAKQMQAEKKDGDDGKMKYSYPKSS